MGEHSHNVHLLVSKWVHVVNYVHKFMNNVQVILFLIYHQNLLYVKIQVMYLELMEHVLQHSQHQMQLLLIQIFNPRQFFEDNANTIVIAPDNIVLPYFPPIIATMPPIILDDDDGNNKMIEHNIIENTENNDVANTSNILSTSVYLLVLSMVIT